MVKSGFQGNGGNAGDAGCWRLFQRCLGRCCAGLGRRTGVHSFGGTEIVQAGDKSDCDDCGERLHAILSVFPFGFRNVSAFCWGICKKKRPSTVLHAEPHCNILGCAQQLEHELNVWLNESRLLNQLISKMWMPALSMVVGDSGSEEGESVTFGVKR